MLGRFLAGGKSPLLKPVWGLIVLALLHDNQISEQTDTIGFALVFPKRGQQVQVS